VIISPLAGKPAPVGILVDVPRLVTAYYAEVPNPEVPAERVSFGTSGHRGSSFDRAFNEWHILAITQAICLYRQKKATNGPLFMGYDTHALRLSPGSRARRAIDGGGRRMRKRPTRKLRRGRRRNRRKRPSGSSALPAQPRWKVTQGGDGTCWVLRSRRAWFYSGPEILRFGLWTW